MKWNEPIVLNKKKIKIHNITGIMLRNIISLLLTIKAENKANKDRTVISTSRSSIVTPIIDVYSFFFSDKKRALM
ncbi:MAG: hypothetical protein O2827_06200, partial [Verrucomicrobia bacterium]|nr:hypothetical protein [Verrucomicrobiota bacterium]